MMLRSLPLFAAPRQALRVWWASWWRWPVLIGLALLLARVVYLQGFSPYGLAPDEAQYWSWLQNPDWSYLTKPPLTTVLMGLSTALLGDTLVGVKLFALLGQLAMPLLGAAVARQLVPNAQQHAAGWWAFGLLTTLPLINAGGLMMAPDTVLLPLWLAALLLVVRAMERSTAAALCWPRWVLIGLLVGLGGLAKYTAALFFPLLLAFLLWRRRRWLRAPQPYVAGLIALALQTPVLYWNATNGWAGLHHLLWQAQGDDRHGGLGTLLEFLGSQALVLGPLGLVLLVMGWWWATRPRRSDAAALVLLFTLVIFFGFCVQTFSAKVQANWPLLGTVTALPLAAAWLAQARLKRWVHKLIVAGLVVNAGLGLALYNTVVLRPVLPLKADPTKDLRGWPEMGTLFGLLLQRLENPLVLGVRYQTLAPLAFHTPNIEWFYWNAEGRRATDYDDWRWPQSLPRRPVVLVKENDTFPIHVAELFTECRPWHSLGVEEDGTVVRRLYTWLCWGYRTPFE